MTAMGAGTGRDGRRPPPYDVTRDLPERLRASTGKIEVVKLLKPLTSEPPEKVDVSHLFYMKCRWCASFATRACRRCA